MKENNTLYNLVRDSMKTGDMLAWHSNSLIGKVIRWKTIPSDIPKDSPLSVNHTSTIIRLKEYEGLKRRVFITEALENGIVLDLLSKRIQKFDGKVWLYPLKRNWDDQRQLIGERLLSVVGTPYDYTSILKQIFGYVSVDLRAFFCSEHHYFGLGFSGIAPNPYELCLRDYYKEAINIK